MGWSQCLNLASDRGREGHFEALEAHASAHPDEFPEALERLHRLFGVKGRFRTANKDTVRLCDGISGRRAAGNALFPVQARVEHRKGLYSTTELTGVLHSSARQA